MVECQIIQDGKIRDQVIQKNWWNESTKGNTLLYVEQNILVCGLFSYF